MGGSYRYSLLILAVKISEPPCQDNIVIYVIKNIVRNNNIFGICINTINYVPSKRRRRINT